MDDSAARYGSLSLKPSCASMYSEPTEPADLKFINASVVTHQESNVILIITRSVLANDIVVLSWSDRRPQNCDLDVLGLFYKCQYKYAVHPHRRRR